MFIQDKVKTNQTIKRELTSVLYKNFPINFLSTLLIATILFWELSGHTLDLHLNIWYATFCGVLVFRIAVYCFFYYTQNRPDFLSIYYNLFLIGASLTALHWGCLGSLLMPDDIIHQTFILIIISGTFAGAVQSLGADYKVCITYVFLALAPILAWEIHEVIQGNRIYLGILILMTLYTVYTIVVGYRYYTVLVSNIKLHLKNAELFEDLKKYTEQIEFFSQLETILATCNTEEEVCSVGVQFLGKLLPNTSGGIYLFSPARDKLKALKTWGKTIKLPSTFHLDHCHAIIHKHIHLGKENHFCRHFPKNISFHMCIPLSLPEKLYGIVTIARLHNSDIPTYHQSMLVRIANIITSSINRLELKEALESQAMRDFLTGLYNKRYLNDYLKMEMSRAKRKKTKLAILMMDIDHFKNFNDQYGHETGDDILQEVGSFLKKHTRDYDAACRYGGEEFVIIMPGASVQTASQRAEILRQGVKTLSIVINNEIISGINLSFGVAVYPDHGTTMENLLEAADQALYQAKKQGRDQVCIAST